MKEKQWCKGGDGEHLARPDRPSSLVTCPECGRAGLNGEEPHRHGMYASDDIRDQDGHWRLVVPRHQPRKQRPEDIGQASFGPVEGRYLCDSREWDR